MGLNKFVQRLATFGFAPNAQRVELLKNVNLHEIRGRLTATVTVANGAADGVLVTEGIQRFLTRLRLVHDGVEVVQPIDGRDLSQLTARVVAAVTAPANLAAPGVGATNVSFDFVIPLARQYLAEPILTCIPGTLPVRQELAIYFEFDQSRSNANAATTLGSGAFVAGGDRDVVVSAVALTLEQEYSVGLVVPWYLPRIQVRTTVQTAAANTELPLVITQADPYDAVLFQFYQGTQQAAQDAFNFVSLIAGGGSVRYIDRADSVMLQRRDQALFPAVVTVGQVGRIFIRHADNGRLGSVVVPRDLPDPQYLFDVDAPTAAPGFVRAIFMALVKQPGVTTP